VNVSSGGRPACFSLSHKRRADRLDPPHMGLLLANSARSSGVRDLIGALCDRLVYTLCPPVDGNARLYRWPRSRGS
jgi:hypothetical protein